MCTSTLGIILRFYNIKYRLAEKDKARDCVILRSEDRTTESSEPPYPNFVC